MHHRVETLIILRCHPAHILGESQRLRVIVVVEPAVAREAAIHPENAETTLLSSAPRAKRKPRGENEYCCELPTTQQNAKFS